ncbi:MAG: amidophosphoribosyltransferase, partial [Prevotella sp.]|nr:amidophosphoribosyltransferase [Prevotella sp.]
CDDVKELEPGTALIVKRNGECSIERILPQKGNSACSFERIYFSRGNDRDIYNERKRLGEQLTQPVLKAIDGDTKNTVFSFIPNTAEIAFYGMVDGFDERVRSEKVVSKDIKLRTFITEDNSRNDLASHVYDITYESIRAGQDNLVVIDDSIVRGTTLKESIFRILDRLHPKKIVMVSSAPQVRYPDYYGIDMPRLEEFCAFRAAIELLKEQGQHEIIDNTYRKCLEELKKPTSEMTNCVRNIYKPFTVEQINEKIVEMLRPENMETPIELVFQSIEGLHNAVPDHPGDWYFTGHFPTPGGTKLCLQAFVNYVEKYYQFEEKF